MMQFLVQCMSQLSAQGCRLVVLHQVGGYLGYTGHQIN
jgi:hypothetical protein